MKKYIRFIHRINTNDFIIQERSMFGMWKDITYLAHGSEVQYSDAHKAVLLSCVITEKWNATKNSVQVIEYPTLIYHF